MEEVVTKAFQLWKREQRQARRRYPQGLRVDALKSFRPVFENEWLELHLMFRG